MTRPRMPPPSAREVRRQTTPRRMLNRQEAAIYCGVSEALFSRLIRMGRGPEPKLIGTGRAMLQRWSIEQLDQFIDRLPTRGGTEGAPAKPRLLSF